MPRSRAEAVGANILEPELQLSFFTRNNFTVLNGRHFHPSLCLMLLKIPTN